MTLTFANDDKFERKQFADRLTKVISTFYPYADDAFVLSLNASFGSGKTTFLEMWKHELESQGYKVIHINAWATDFDDEPFIHIASTLLDELAKDTKAEKTKSALKTALGATALIANNLLEQAIGVNVQTIAKDIEADKNSADLQKIGDEIYKEFSFKKKAYEVLKAQLAEYINKLEKNR